MISLALPLTTLLAFGGYTVSVMLQAEQSLIDFGISLMSRPGTAQVVIDHLETAWTVRPFSQR